MTPQTRKVIVITGISSAILALTFLIPAVIVPTYKTAEKSATCTDFNCAAGTYQKCDNKQVSNSSGFVDMLSNGVKGMMCMTGISQFDGYYQYISALSSVSTFKSQSVDKN